MEGVTGCDQLQLRRGASVLLLLLWSIVAGIQASAADAYEQRRTAVNDYEARPLAFTARQTVSTFKAARPAPPLTMLGNPPTVVPIPMLAAATPANFAEAADAISASARPYRARDPPAA